MTIVAIHQPQYLPWIPYFDKADAADIFVYLDQVQYQKNGVQNRNQIKTAGGAIWLTVPVTAPLGTPINMTPISKSPWGKKHLRSIEQSYAKAANANLVDSGLRAILERDWQLLGDLNIAVTEWLFELLDIKTKRVRASELAVTGSGQELVLNICKALGADAYLSGHGAASYQQPAGFAQAGIALQYQNYEHPVYEQCLPKLGFIKNLSALDLVLNCGASSLATLRAGRKFASATV